MAGHGFDIVSRSQWGARSPRYRTTRSAATVTGLYLHWPGTPGRLREDELAATLRVPEDEATDCLITPDLMARLDEINASESNARIDTKAEERAYMRQIQAFHMDVRRWSDYAYNYMIFASGRIYAGRTFKVVPASQAPYNTNGLSICCAIGTADSVSAKMKGNLRDFVRWSEKYARHELRVLGHRDVNQTSCPGDRLHAYTRTLDRI